LETLSIIGGVKVLACKQTSLYNKFVSVGSTDNSSSVSQVYAGAVDLPSSLLFCGDSNATRVSCSLSIHSDSHRHRQVSNTNYTVCFCQPEKFRKQNIVIEVTDISGTANCLRLKTQQAIITVVIVIVTVKTNHPTRLIHSKIQKKLHSSGGHLGRNKIRYISDTHTITVLYLIQ
jgi:hypothetical protein